MNTNQRIKLEDSTVIAIFKMSDGNFGATDALMKIISFRDIDPDSLIGPIGPILLLDTFGIYGSDIYVLYSDICEKDTVKMIAVLRAAQLGLLSANVLKDACSRQDFSGKKLIPVEEIYLKVKQQLPNFNS